MNGEIHRRKHYVKGTVMLFDPDEHYSTVNRKWKRDELLKKEGIFKLTHVCEVLSLNQPALRKLLNEEMKEGKDVYDSYGLKREQGSWVVRMRTFREVVDKLERVVGHKKKKPKLRRIPKNISREAYYKLDGIYKLADVMEPNYLPYAYEQVTAMVKRGIDPKKDEPIPREVCGCWQDPERTRFWLCDFKPFLAFIYSVWREIPLEEARKRVAEETMR